MFILFGGDNNAEYLDAAYDAVRGGVQYKGAVSTLPQKAHIGDAYKLTTTGVVYAWATFIPDNVNKWIPIGMDVATFGTASEVTTVDEKVTTLGNKVGDLTTLTTTAKTSIVAAINELVTRVEALEPEPEPEA